jgi:O-antigen/teichoic acid export membrane protein
MNSKIKKLGSDTFTYGFATVVGRFLNFLLTPMYSNMLFGKEYEFVIYLYTIFAFVNVVYSIGMESAFFRFYTRDNESNAKKVFTHSFLMINILSILFTVIIFLNSDNIASILTDGTLKRASYLIIISSLIPLFDAMIMIPFGFLRMTNKAKQFAMVRFVMIALAVLFNVIFLSVLKMQAEGVILSQLITSFLAVLYFAPLIYKNFISKFDIDLLKNMLKFGIPTLPANLSAIILQVADRPILTELTKSYHLVVTYQVNYRLGIPMMIFVTIFEYAWKPFYLSNYKDSDSKEIYARVFTYFTLVSAVLFLFVSLFIPYIVRIPGIGGKYFINPIYWEGLSIVPIVLLAYYFNGAFTNFSAGFLIEKQTKYLPIAVGIAAIVNVTANFILIPIYGYTGAAWATLIAYVVSSGILYIISLKIYPVKYEWKRITFLIIITGIIFLLNLLSVKLNSIAFEFIAKIVLILMFIVILKFMKFFSKSEIASIIGMISRKK